MKNTINLPVFNISNFQDYNNCMDFDSHFYIRPFNDHIQVNHFIETPHGHDFYLLLLITKGSGIHTIDNVEYVIEPGALFIVSPGKVHYWNLANDTDGYILFFKKDYFKIAFSITGTKLFSQGVTESVRASSIEIDAACDSGVATP